MKIKNIPFGTTDWSQVPKVDARWEVRYTSSVAKILIVDDCPVTRTIIADYLQMGGHVVAGEAANLAQTLAAYEAHRPDLVTVDLSMEHEDGFAVLRALRAADPKAKVLIVSGNSQAKIYDQLLAAGAAGFIVKPFSIVSLTSAVAKGLA